MASVWLHVEEPSQAGVSQRVFAEGFISPGVMQERFREGSLGATRVRAAVTAVTGGIADFSMIRDDKRGEQAPAGRQSGWVLGAVREQACTDLSQPRGERSPQGTSSFPVNSADFSQGKSLREEPRKNVIPAGKGKR